MSFCLVSSFQNNIADGNENLRIYVFFTINPTSDFVTLEHCLFVHEATFNKKTT